MFLDKPSPREKQPHGAASKEATCGRPAARTASSCAPGAACKQQQLQVPRQGQRQLKLRASLPGDRLVVGTLTLPRKGWLLNPRTRACSSPLVCLVICDARRVAAEHSAMQKPPAGIEPATIRLRSACSAS